MFFLGVIVVNLLSKPKRHKVALSCSAKLINNCKTVVYKKLRFFVLNQNNYFDLKPIFILINNNYMKENSSNYATISYNSHLRDELKEICLRNGISQKDYIEFTLRFFQRTGLDPKDPNEILSQKLKASENRLIGFLKTQDKNELNHFNSLFDLLQVQANTIATLTNALEIMHQELNEFKELTRISLNRR